MGSTDLSSSIANFFSKETNIYAINLEIERIDTKVKELRGELSKLHKEQEVLEWLLEKTRKEDG